MSEDPQKFTEQMLAATFDFARLALSSLILLNSGAATAALAFIGAHGRIIALLPYALGAFALGAASGAVSALLAYFGQRANWEAIRTNPAGPMTTANIFLRTAAVCAVLGYLLFVGGCVLATIGLNRIM
jgi:hypothetical protein